MNQVHLSAIDLNLLVTLHTLLETRSTVIAAKRLGRTQSAVSHALGRLRGHFGDALLARAGRTLTPTPVAERLSEPLARLVRSAEAIVSGGAPFEPKQLARTFHLALTDYAEIELLPRLLPRLRAHAPDVDVVTRNLGGDVEAALLSREVDLAYGTSFRARAGLLTEHLYDDGMRVLLRRGHPASRRPLTPARYAALDHVLVAPRGSAGGVVDEALARLGLRRRVVLRLPSFSAAALIVARTDMVVTLPSSFARSIADLAPLTTLPPPIALTGFSFQLAYAAAVRDAPEHVWFRAEVNAAMRELAPRRRAASASTRRSRPAP
jgi:DNA-binding transcriptional LysR family regulator